MEVAFDDGSSYSLPAEYLRVESPSAEVQGHGPGQKVIVAERAHVGILALEPVGNYAVRIRFDDLHDTFINWGASRKSGGRFIFRNWTRAGCRGNQSGARLLS